MLSVQPKTQPKAETGDLPPAALSAHLGSGALLLAETELHAGLASAETAGSQQQQQNKPPCAGAFRARGEYERECATKGGGGGAVIKGPKAAARRTQRVATSLPPQALSLGQGGWKRDGRNRGWANG